MSFDLMVLAVDACVDAGAVRAMLERCQGNPHPEGELDERIVAFYGQRAIDAIARLAAVHGLVIYDPQSDDVYGPARR